MRIRFGCGLDSRIYGNFQLIITYCSYECLQFSTLEFSNKLKYGALREFVFTPLNVPRTYALAVDGNPIPFSRPVWIQRTHIATPSLWIPNWAGTWIARTFNALWCHHSCIECFLSNFCSVVLLLCTSLTIALWHSSLKESMEMNYNVALGLLTMETSATQFTLHLIANGKGTNI